MRGERCKGPRCYSGDARQHPHTPSQYSWPTRTITAVARDQALSGNYGGATSTFVNGWTLRWTQTYHPGYELQISTPAMTQHATPAVRVR